MTQKSGAPSLISCPTVWKSLVQDRVSVITLKSFFTHFSRALSACPHDKSLIQHWRINILVRPERLLSVYVLSACASSCMSILYRPGVLSGSRTAWSREITVSGRGLIVEGGGLVKMVLGCWSPARESTAEKSITFPTQHQHLPRLTEADQLTPTAPSTPEQTVITKAWTNLVLYALMNGA